MKLDLIKYSLGNITNRKLRSFLSILSILIGIMAIFAILSFGQGLRGYISSIAEEMGTNRIIIQARGFTPPGTSSVFFTKEEVDFVAKINGVNHATGLTFTYAELKYKDYKTKIEPVVSYAQDENKKMVEETFAFEIIQGRSLKKGDVDKIVIGYYYTQPDKVFSKPILIGDKIQLNGKTFEVIGYNNELGNPADDQQLFVTLDGMEYLTGIKDTYHFVILEAQPDMAPKLLAEKVQEKLRKRRGQKEGNEDFYAQTFEDAIATFTSIITGLNAVLFVIAFISVIVAAVNIMNTMYTAVLERTKEIGILKSIGARNSDIFFVFVFEAGMLGLLGGLVGVILGYLIATAGGNIAASAGFALLRPAFPWWLTFGCLAFSFLVGAASGFNPARHAAKQKPVDALRYE
ncbi:MAG: ABC transporter permease [Nanoarchaeota archaeon]